MQVSLVIGYSPVTKGICSGELQVLTSRLKCKGRVSTSLTPNIGMKNPDSTLKYHIAEIISLGLSIMPGEGLKGILQLVKQNQNQVSFGSKWVHVVIKRFALHCLLWAHFKNFKQFFSKSDNFYILNNKKHSYHLMFR